MTQPHDEYAAAQAVEYGQFTAAQPIELNGARAFNTGDPVPAGHVASGLVDKRLVTKVASKTEAVAASKEL